MRSYTIVILYIALASAVCAQTQAPTSVQEIVQRSMDARAKQIEALKMGVVRVEARKEVDEVGTGMVISASPDRILILTALHVVKDAETVNVVFYSDRVTPVLARKLPKHSDALDLAVLEVRPTATIKLPSDIQPFHFAVSSSLRQGEQIYTANGDWVPIPNTITQLNHDADPQRFEYTNVSVGEGFSGGPIFDQYDNVIGMHDAMSPRGNYAIAIKIESAFQALDALGYNVPKLGPILPFQVPGTGTTAKPYAENPDMFVRITPQVMPNFVRNARAGRATMAGWKVTVIATPFGSHYDVKVQMVMKGMGSAGSTIELPDLQPGYLPSSFAATTNELGKEAVICYTARGASEPAQRWTGTFAIHRGSEPLESFAAVRGAATFVAAHEPTLEKASDAPCGGLKAVKESATPSVEEMTAPEIRKPEMGSSEAALALARGSQLYNARRYSEARPLLIKACEGGGSADACNSVGFMYQNSMGVAADYAKAREYYLKSCNDDSSFSCSNLATLYRDGLGVPRDYAQAAKLFEKGCDAGVPEGCVAAGEQYMNHLGVAVDNAHALELYKKACDAQFAAGCGDEGLIYAKGLGVPKDLAFAASLFKRACTMGSRNSCFSIGMMYRGGEGVPHDPAKSKEYFGRACDMGDQESCRLAQ